MNFGYFSYPQPPNETVLNYAPNSAEKINLKKALAELKSQEIDIPMYIGNKEVKTSKKIAIHPPHETQHTLGHFSAGDATHVKQAIDAALAAKASWENMSWENRAAIFLKAADLLAGPYRATINAATPTRVVRMLAV